MATRSRTSFQKRQKELLRMEKQKEKAARRLQRKTEVKDPSDPDAWQADEFGVFPDGTLAEDISPDSISPDGISPDSISPDSDSPDGASPDRTSPAGTLPAPE
jgi:hypothetical protein